MQMTAATLMLWWDNKDEEWYKQLPAKERFLYWHIPAGDEIIRIPRSFEAGAMFAALPESMADAWYRQEPERMIEWFTNTFDTLSPVQGLETTPVLAKVTAEQLANENFFFDTPIVPRSEQYQPAEEQYNEYTTQASKALGELFNASPRRIDHAIRGVAGPVAMDILDVVGLGRTAQDREAGASDIPIVGRLFQRGGRGLPVRMRAVGNLYDKYDEYIRRSYSEEQYETDEERQVRLMLKDATQAISSLSFVRQNTYAQDKRQAILRETLNIAKNALDAAKEGDIQRERFKTEKKESEVREEAIKIQKEADKVKDMGEINPGRLFELHNRRIELANDRLKLARKSEDKSRIREVVRDNRKLINMKPLLDRYERAIRDLEDRLKTAGSDDVNRIQARIDELRKKFNRKMRQSGVGIDKVIEDKAETP